jgi:hypothetical protein
MDRINEEFGNIYERASAPFALRDAGIFVIEEDDGPTI